MNQNTKKTDLLIIGQGTAAVQAALSAAATGTTYYYWVKATNPLGASGFSPYDSGHLTGMSTDCHPDDNTLCLNKGRFRVEVAWETEQGGSGKGHEP